MSIANLVSVDIDQGSVIYWFLFEGIEETFDFDFESYAYGIVIDDSNQIEGIYGEEDNPHGLRQPLNENTDEVKAVRKVIQSSSDPEQLNPEFINAGANYLFHEVILRKMSSSSIAQSFVQELNEIVDRISEEYSVDNPDKDKQQLSKKFH